MSKIVFGETTIEIPPLDYSHCNHAVTELDDDAKMLYCQKCKKHISAYEYIRRHVVDLAFLFRRIAEAESRLKLKFGQIETAIKHEQRIKARIRRLKQKELKHEH